MQNLYSELTHLRLLTENKTDDQLNNCIESTRAEETLLAHRYNTKTIFFFNKQLLMNLVIAARTSMIIVNKIKTTIRTRVLPNNNQRVHNCKSTNFVISIFHKKSTLKRASEQSQPIEHILLDF